MPSSGNQQSPARSPNSSRRDKVRQGKLIRSWTEEEERFLLQSRSQKVPYKQIARRLDKTVLACRLHHHHLKAGRKGRRPDEIEDDFSELSDTTSASDSPSPPANTGESAKSPQEQSRKFSSGPQTFPVKSAPSHSPRLPNFETFVRETFSDSFPRRTASTPHNDANVATATWSSDSRSTSFPANDSKRTSYPAKDSRHGRTQSGRPQDNKSQSYQGAKEEERPADRRHH
ncbi:hypothetical protein RBB50_000825 [Rhinocladiella similis]